MCGLVEVCHSACISRAVPLSCRPVSHTPNIYHAGATRGVRSSSACSSPSEALWQAIQTSVIYWRTLSSHQCLRLLVKNNRKSGSAFLKLWISVGLRTILTTLLVKRGNGCCIANGNLSDFIVDFDMPLACQTGMPIGTARDLMARAAMVRQKSDSRH